MQYMDNTPTVHDDDGFDHWHQHTCRNFSLSECSVNSERPFRASITSRAFGPLTLSQGHGIEAEGIRMTRGPVEIRKDQRDHFMLYLVLDGRVDLAQGGREASACAGDLFLYDQTMPFTLDFHRTQTILVNVPRPMLASRVPDARRLTARRLAGASKMGALAGSLVQQMSGLDDDIEHGIADRLATSAMDILATALTSELGDGEEPRKEGHRLLPQVERYMLAHLHDADLDLAAIARAQNIAPRTLSRVFAARGTTPIRWLWKQRLAASYKALSQGHVNNVTDAAVNSGFTDMSHFSRAFKREFGRLPHMVQRAGTSDAEYTGERA